MNVRDAKELKTASLQTPTDLKPGAVRDVSGGLNILLADMFALYVKTIATGGLRHPAVVQGDQPILERRQVDLVRLTLLRISSKLSFKRSWMIFTASLVDCLAVVALSCAPLTAISKTFLANSVCRARLS